MNIGRGIRLLLNINVVGGVVATLLVLRSSKDVAMMPIDVNRVSARVDVVADATEQPRFSEAAPFRLDRTVPRVRFGTQTAVVEQVPPPVQDEIAPPSVTGLVLGSEPSVVLTGLPGVTGSRVFHVGQQLEGWTVERITSDSVMIRGTIHAWTLPVPKR